MIFTCADVRRYPPVRCALGNFNASGMWRTRCDLWLRDQGPAIWRCRPHYWSSVLRRPCSAKRLRQECCLHSFVLSKSLLCPRHNNVSAIERLYVPSQTTVTVLLTSWLRFVVFLWSLVNGEDLFPSSSFGAHISYLDLICLVRVVHIRLFLCSFFPHHVPYRTFKDVHLL